MESFEPFRVVGSICSTVPISATTLYGAPLLMVATGRTYQLYRGKELTMLRGGPTFAEPVASVAQTGKYRFVAEGPRVHAAVHHKPLWTDHHEAVTRPTVLRVLAQDDLLFVLGADKRICVRDVRTGTVKCEILVERSESVTCMALLTGYDNKLIVATEEGGIQLYNYKTGACLWHREGGRGKDDGRNTTTAASGSSPLAILSLACSAFKDIVAYGTSGGRVVVLNVGSDEVITTFEHQQGAVTALAFRADKASLLAAGTSLGEVVVWDLEHRCMDGVLTRGKQVRSEREALESAHGDTVHSLITFGNDTSTTTTTTHQPEWAAALLVTGGADNALMQFRFDTVDGLGLLVRERRGHMGSCTTAAFYNGDLVATAGADRAVRVTHVFSDRASWEVSQGKLGRKGRAAQKGREELKMPPAVALAASTTRNYQWASLVSIHTASAQLCGWRMDTRAIDFKLSGIHTAAHTARSVAMSDCGNFAVVGYSSGNVSVVSVQNRSIRQLFDPALGGADRAHEGSVECVQVACGNTTVVSAGLDGVIKMWSLHPAVSGGNNNMTNNTTTAARSGELRATIPTGQPITASCLHRGSSLLLVAQHFTIRGYHCNPELGLSRQELRTPVRALVGHSAPITALAIAPDTARYVASTSGDGALLLWDLAAAACVGQYRFASPATSLAFHPDALLLCTTHAGERGAFLWVNNLRYGFVPEVVPHPERRAVEETPFLHFPTAHGTAEGDEGDDDDDNGKGGDAAAGGGAVRRTGKRKAAATAAAALTAEDKADRAEQREGRAAEADLFDETADVALMQRRRRHEEWAALDAIATDGLRLSGVPRSTWFNLTVLDQIKEKNQPLLPPKKKDVPFFLPTTQELRPTFILVASDGNKAAGGGGGGGEARQRRGRADLSALSPVQSMLINDQHDALMAHILSSGNPNSNSINNTATHTHTNNGDDGASDPAGSSATPAPGPGPVASADDLALVSAPAIDLLIQQAVDYSDDVKYTPAELDRMAAVLGGLLRFLSEWLRRGEMVDLVQGILADVVRTHGPLLTRFGPALLPELTSLAERQNRVRHSVDHLVSYPATLAGTFSGSVL